MTKLTCSPEPKLKSSNPYGLLAGARRQLFLPQYSTDPNRSELLNSVSMASVKSEEESDASMRQRLVTSLSQSFPGSALSKALQCMTESDDEMKDPLSSSCFAELRMEKADMEEDDELTSLAWLQDSDLLKNIHAGEEENADSQKENGDIRKLVSSHPQTHPSHVPYNPHKHIHSKPPYSFSCLIFMAVEDSQQKRLPVKDIYNWILTHFPYFQNAPTGWKNSVRHNLSLNKCFKKVDKDKGQTIGKGSLWCIDPDYRPNLLQALRKTPYHPYHQLQMLASPQSASQNLPFSRPLPLSPRFTANQISPHLFPFLSKRLAQSSLDTDIDVANALVSLKGFNSSSRLIGSRGGMWSTTGKRKQLTQLSEHVKRKNLGPIICTLNPSEDHTYSVKSSLSDTSSGCASPCSSEEQYDFGSDDDIDEDSEYDGWASDYDEVDGDNNNEGGDLNSSKGQKAQIKFPRHSKAAKRVEEDEDMKIAEGANALLNLAGINTKILPLRSISPVVNSAPEVPDSS